MKYLVLLLTLFMMGCASSQPENKNTPPKLSELDAQRYQVINIDKFDNESTSCGMDRLLECLDVSEGTCHKIYRAAAVDCFDKFYETNSKEADLLTPSNQKFIEGCMLIRVLGYCKDGISQAIQCMESS